jgi:hypothetical protein
MRHLVVILRAGADPLAWRVGIHGLVLGALVVLVAVVLEALVLVELVDLVPVAVRRTLVVGDAAARSAHGHSVLMAVAADLTADVCKHVGGRGAPAAEQREARTLRVGIGRSKSTRRMLPSARFTASRITSCTLMCWKSTLLMEMRILRSSSDFARGCTSIVFADHCVTRRTLSWCSEGLKCFPAMVGTRKMLIAAGVFAG